MNSDNSATPNRVEPIRRLEEQILFLDRRQDELLGAIADLSARFDALQRRLSLLEHRPQSIGQPGGEQQGSHGGTPHQDQADPGHPA